MSDDLTGAERAEDWGPPVDAQDLSRQWCEVCRKPHAKVVTFTQNVGKLFLRSKYEVIRCLCPQCTISVGRHVQSKTLATGWWGTISLFVNIGAVLSNSSELWKAHAKSRRLNIDLQSVDSLPIGRPVLLRPMSWVGPIVIAIVIAMAVQKEKESASRQWSVGNCVERSHVSTQSFVPIGCSESHFGKIIGHVEDSARCPINAEYSAGESGDVYCIDTDA